MAGTLRIVALPLADVDLRHAHASVMLQQGVHPKTVSQRLDHSSIAITMDTYSHVLPGLQAEAAAQLDRLLAGRREITPRQLVQSYWLSHAPDLVLPFR